MWQVLLIGGASGTGKTGLAQRLGRKLGMSVLLADDIRMAIQHLTTPDQFPDLHFFFTHPDIWDQPAEMLRDGWIAVGQQVSTALEMVIAHHLVVSGVGSIIIEGDGILPGLAVQTQFVWTKLDSPDLVRSIFLHEPDESILLENMRQRGRGFDEFTTQQQVNFAHGAWLFGNWLKSEAEKCACPVIPCRPWDTLDERITIEVSH